MPLENISLAVTESYDTINNESIIRFFWKLKKEHYQVEQKFHLIMDGAAYYRKELVINVAKPLNFNIDLHCILPSNPNLNPRKCLWIVINEHVWNSIYCSENIHFISAVKEFFDATFPEIAGSLTSRITDNFQLLKPASSS